MPWVVAHGFFHVMQVWLCLLCFYTTPGGRISRDLNMPRKSKREHALWETDGYIMIQRNSQVAALRAALGLGRTKQEEKSLGFKMVQLIADTEE